jgi:hypothetical protein
MALSRLYEGRGHYVTNETVFCRPPDGDTVGHASIGHVGPGKEGRGIKIGGLLPSRGTRNRSPLKSIATVNRDSGIDAT